MSKAVSRAVARLRLIERTAKRIRQRKARKMTRQQRKQGK